jgi:tetratricopeptide (TPR) repeat protein
MRYPRTRRFCLWRLSLFSIALLQTAIGSAQEKEQPVGFVSAATGVAELTLRGNDSWRTARAGDILFSGDSLKTGSGSVEFIFCPKSTTQTLGRTSVVTLGDNELNLRLGSFIDQRAVEVCLLPKLEREPAVSVLEAPLRGQGSQLSPTGSYPSRLRSLPPDMRAQLSAIDKALSAAPDDQRLRLARSVLLQRAGLVADAIDEYDRVANRWKDEPRIRLLVYELEKQGAAHESGRGKTYALLVGISTYARLKPQDQLEFADADAIMFQRYLKSARGGEVPDANITLLTNGQATLTAIRRNMVRLLQTAGKDDTVILLIAAHGTMVRNRPYIVPSDANPQNPADSAYPMSTVQQLMFGQLKPFRRALIFADVCHAGQIGAIIEPPVGRPAASTSADSEYVGLLATQKKEVAYEHRNFGGGHGAFTYFLLRGLTRPEISVSTVGDLVEYVRQYVSKATGNRQHPKDELGVEWQTVLPELRLAEPHPDVLNLPDWQPLPATYSRRKFKAESANGVNTQPLELNEGVEFEESGQQVILQYLEGDEVPQTRGDFEEGARQFTKALVLTPDSLFLRAREAFCEGRAFIFAKRYDLAIDLLERSVRLDPSGAYAYNALGIAYLEQAKYTEAIEAFQDAIRRAPYWAYPRHNLALARTQLGDYRAAIDAYREAMNLAPQYSYLPYNLGLVYQRMNRRKDAEAAYLNAVHIAPWRSEPYTALGLLKATEGRDGDARRYYEVALASNPSTPNLLATRQNLGLLLARKRKTTPAAFGYWQDNIKAADYLPSHLSMAETLVRRRQLPEALLEYREIVRLRPDYLSARLDLAGLLDRLRKPEQALAELLAASQRYPNAAIVLERIGELERKSGNKAEARTAFQEALENTQDPASRKRLRTLIEKLK